MRRAKRELLGTNLFSPSRATAAPFFVLSKSITSVDRLGTHACGLVFKDETATIQRQGAL